MLAVLALEKTVSAPPIQPTASQASSHGLDLVEERHPDVAKRLPDAEQAILLYLAFPTEHWRSIRRPNALEA